MSVAENIRNIRMELNMTQCELAQKVRISQSMMAQIERGTKVPTVALAKEIAEALGKEIGDIVA